MNRHSRRLDRRRVAQLAAANEKTIEADARFFERFPDRSHRIRDASRPEIDLLRHQHGGTMLPPGACIYTIVRQVRPGWRLRACMVRPVGLDTDLPEETCRLIFEAAARPGTQAREVERAFAELAGVHHG